MNKKLPFIIISLLLVSLFLFFACHVQKKAQVVSTQKNDSILNEIPKTQILKIATFNVQNFGKSKLSKQLVMDTLVAIIRNFDIVAVQEISDVSNQTAGKFLDLINANTDIKYKMVCSNRTGREANDKSSAEQYAFYYKSDLVKLVDTALFDDSKNDYFQREPYIAQFKEKLNGHIFEICTIHTAPDHALDEIAALSYVAKWIPTRFKNAENMIFCGDFNASCSYASDEELNKLEFRNPPFFWIIPDDAKTNLSKNTCAYDRFVTNLKLKYKIKKWEVYRYFKTKAVSDHWPVYIELEL